MITFKQYLLEFGDLSTLTTDEIKLEKTLRGYEYKFGDYRVYMNRTSMDIDYGKIAILNEGECYAIGFKHNNNYYLTKKGNAFTVYNTVFKVIKKFMDEVNPKGLYFSGYTDEMDLLYAKFYKKYLAVTHMKVENFYLRKDVYHTLPDYAKEAVQKAMQSFDDYDSERLNKIKSDKKLGRLQHMHNQKVAMTYQQNNPQWSQNDNI
jgi:hypothetical protein